MSEYINDSSEDELVDDNDNINVVNDYTQGSTFEYLFHSNYFNDIDSINKATENVYDSINYNNAPIEKWNYKRKLKNYLKAKYTEKIQYGTKLKRDYLGTVKHEEHECTVGQTFTNKLDTVTSSSVQLNIPCSTIKEKFTSTPDYSPNQQSAITQQSRNKLEQKLGTENLKKFDDFDQSESDEEEKPTIIQERTNITDYVRVPTYEMEKVLIEDTSKFRFVV